MAEAARRMRVPEYVLTRVVDEQLVLLNLDNEQFYGLDEVATTMWDALVAEPTVSAAVAVLLERFDVDAKTLRADVEQLLDGLQTRGLVELDPQ